MSAPLASTRRAEGERPDPGPQRRARPLQGTAGPRSGRYVVGELGERSTGGAVYQGTGLTGGR